MDLSYNMAPSLVTAQALDHECHQTIQIICFGDRRGPKPINHQGVGDDYFPAATMISQTPAARCAYVGLIRTKNLAHVHELWGVAASQIPRLTLETAAPQPGGRGSRGKILSRTHGYDSISQASAPKLQVLSSIHPPTHFLMLGISNRPEFRTSLFLFYMEHLLML